MIDKLAVSNKIIEVHKDLPSISLVSSSKVKHFLVCEVCKRNQNRVLK